MPKQNSQIKSFVDPGHLLSWTKKRVGLAIGTSMAFGILSVAGFFLIQEYSKMPATDAFTRTEKQAPPDFIEYRNEYWGIAFKYPGTWTKIVGSFEDGSYYFASQPIHFINELEPGQALVILKTYNNWENLPFETWFIKQRDTYFPRGKLTVEPAAVANTQAKHIQLEFAFPINNIGFWDGYVLSKDEATKYILILGTDNEQTAAKYETQFSQITNSIKLTTDKRKQ